MGTQILDRVTSFLSKKFILAVLAMVLVVFFVDIAPDAKMSAITWLVGLYATANVGQKVFSSDDEQG